MGFRVLVSRHPAIQTTELLTLAPAGLSPAEHPSLYWTHNRTCGFPAYGLYGAFLVKEWLRCFSHFLSRSGCAAFRLSWSSHSLVRPALQDSSVPTARLSRRRAQRRSRMAAPFNGHPKGLSLTDASTAARYRRSARKHR